MPQSRSAALRDDAPRSKIERYLNNDISARYINGVVSDFREKYGVEFGAILQIETETEKRKKTHYDL